MTDPQKPRVYAALAGVQAQLDQYIAGTCELRLHNSVLVAPREYRFHHLDEVAAYVRRVEATDWYQARWPHVRPVEVVGRASNHASYGDGRIYLNPNPFLSTNWSLRELVVLHELGHHVSIGHAHGPSFAAAVLALVQHAMSPEAGLLLSDAFHTHGVAVEGGVLA